MTSIRCRALFVLPLLLGIAGHAEESLFWKTTIHDIAADHRAFYSLKGLKLLAGGLLAAGGLAHSSADENARDWYQDSVREDGTDEAARLVKPFGHGLVTLPVMGAGALLSHWDTEFRFCRSMGRWGVRSLRAVLVGAPPLLFLQRALGSTRPSDPDAHSHWQPFDDSNGVSGHAFIGAVPFLTAGRMTDSVWIRMLFYMTSTLPGWSRVNDDDHYLSQATLGWWLAWLAIHAVETSDNRSGPLRFTAWITADALTWGVRIPL